MSTAGCTHSFPDPHPDPIEQIGDCRDCGISYRAATQANTVCGLPHHDYPESTCAEPASHYQRDRDSHAAPLVIDGRQCGAVVWDEPEEQQ